MGTLQTPSAARGGVCSFHPANTLPQLRPGRTSTVRTRADLQQQQQRQQAKGASHRQESQYGAQITGPPARIRPPPPPPPPPPSPKATKRELLLALAVTAGLALGYNTVAPKQSEVRPAGYAGYAGDLFEKRPQAGQRVLYTEEGGVLAVRQDGSLMRVFATNERPGRLILQSQAGRKYNLDLRLNVPVAIQDRSLMNMVFANPRDWERAMEPRR